jgi:hypothetical protein
MAVPPGTPWPRTMKQGLLAGKEFESQRDYNLALEAAKKRKAVLERRRAERAATDERAAKVAASAKASAEKLSRKRTRG